MRCFRKEKSRRPQSGRRRLWGDLPKAQLFGNRTCSVVLNDCGGIARRIGVFVFVAVCTRDPKSLGGSAPLDGDVCWWVVEVLKCHVDKNLLAGYVDVRARTVRVVAEDAMHPSEFFGKDFLLLDIEGFAV